MNHLLFMDDLKLYGSNQNETDSLVRTVEIVTKDIGVKFGIVWCFSYEEGKRSLM